ncbi:hypothetical protein D3C78_1652490 [compost metagenome]
MRTVRLDDHWATGGQRRCGVTAGHGERQGEIARAKHRDRPQRDLPLTQIGARQRLALRLRAIDTHIQPFTGADRASEHSQLLASTPAFT